MCLSVILKHRDDKAGGNISQHYSITIHTGHDPVITSAWDDYRTVRVQKQILNKNVKYKKGNWFVAYILFFLLNLCFYF